MLADLLSVNRKLMEDLLLRVKRLEYGDAAGDAADDVLERALRE